MKTSQLKLFLLFLASFYSFLFLPLMPLWAQGVPFSNDDIVSPSIHHKPETQPVQAGKPLTIKASISDNIGVEEVMLFYRKSGERKYSSIQMESTGGTFYSATIPAQEVDGPKIEYYIQAYDKVRNLSVRGLKKIPLTLTVLAPLLTDGGSDTATLKKTWYKKWWVWTIVAVVLGVVASGGGGGGGGEKTTGTATVSGPIP